jgi:hypothetical protein
MHDFATGSAAIAHVDALDKSALGGSLPPYLLIQDNQSILMAKKTWQSSSKWVRYLIRWHFFVKETTYSCREVIRDFRMCRPLHQAAQRCVWQTSLFTMNVDSAYNDWITGVSCILTDTRRGEVEALPRSRK